MDKKRKKAPAPGVVALRERIEHWRRTRTSRKPMPEHLWQEAAAVARDHGVYAVCRETGLNYNQLKARAKDAAADVVQQPEFVALELPAAPSPASPCALEVEMVHADGDRMIMRLSVAQASEVTALVRAFRSRER